MCDPLKASLNFIAGVVELHCVCRNILAVESLRPLQKSSIQLWTRFKIEWMLLRLLNTFVDSIFHLEDIVFRSEQLNVLLNIIPWVIHWKHHWIAMKRWWIALCVSSLQSWRNFAWHKLLTCTWVFKGSIRDNRTCLLDEMHEIFRFHRFHWFLHSTESNVFK